MRQENDLGKDPIGRLVVRIALPSMLAQLVNVLYNIVDRMYIGNIAQTGDLALAGVGVCGPVITMVGSAAALIGIGGAPLMSIYLGEGKREKAFAVVANCFLMLCILSVALTAVLFPMKEPMLLFFGASNDFVCRQLFFYLSHRHNIRLAFRGDEPVYYLSGVC